MAQTTEPAPIGVRLARLRSARGMTAQDLADALNGSISRSVITNVENGRKRDLTATEVLLLSRALDVSVWALLLETADPWSVVRLPGVDLEEITVAEAASAWGDAFGDEVGDIPGAVKDMGDQLVQTLVALRRFTRRAVEIENELSGDDDQPPSPYDLYVPEGTIADRPHLERVRYEYKDAMVAMVMVLAARNALVNSGDDRLAAIPERAERQVESLKEVVTMLARFYGDDDVVYSLDAADGMKMPMRLFGRTRLSGISNGYLDGSAADSD